MRATRFHLFGLAAASLIAYAPFLSLPFISDDYTQIWLSRMFGPVSGWDDLARDALYRCRATSLLLTHGIDLAFGLWPPAYFVAGVLLHILNVWLVLAIGFWKVVGFRVSTVAAYVFAVTHSHQEAVVWHAASPELLVFAFVLLAALAWTAWLRRRRMLFYAASLLSFAFALLSKESGVSAIGFLILISLVERMPVRRLAVAVGPFAMLSAVYAAGVYLGRNDHLHLHDGTFSLAAPVWITLPHSYLRMLWVWGVMAIIALALLRKLGERAVLVGAVWIAIGLLPYSFLLYMNRVPSRHTYLAGLGMALIVACAYRFLTVRKKYLLAGAFLVSNCAYLWIKKLPQYEQRAAASERFLNYARSHPGMIRVRCYPGSAWTARHSANMVLGRPLESVIDATAETGPVAPGEYCDRSDF